MVDSIKKQLDSQFSSLVPRLEVCIDTQLLTLVTESLRKSYVISTAKNGVGQSNGSGCTPAGYHIVRAKIGGGAPINSVFVGRRATGEIYSSNLAKAYPKRDWILTRIMWLSGLEPGFNRLGNVDSMRRYIYIHGTPDTEPMGKPLSHGCIRMRNEDLVELYELTPAGTKVIILEH